MSYVNKTEEQEFNEVKSWFKQNGTPILIAVLIASAATFSWNYWQKHQKEAAQQASMEYQNTVEAYLQNPEKNAPLVEKFSAEHKDSYGVFALLEQAKVLNAQGDFATAQNLLQQALTMNEDATLKNVLLLRLAAVHYQQQHFDLALSSLNQISDPAWEVRKLILVGDVQAAQGNKEAAKSAYQQVKPLLPEAEQVLIDVRLNNL